MLVDVTFDSVPLCKGANARSDGQGWFVEMEQPMPVGTLLEVSGETQATVRVERVVEGVGAGMLLVPATADKGKPAPEPPKKEAKPETKADDGDDEPEIKDKGGGGNGAGKDRRKKPRKTVMGH